MGKGIRFFRIGEETRFAAQQSAVRYHDSYGRFCDYRPPYSAVVSKVFLEDTIKRAQDVSPWRMVSFDFGDTVLTVRGFDRNREAEADASFTKEIPYVRSHLQNMQLLLDSSILLAICKLIESPMLRFRFEAANQPLQIESGSLQFVMNTDGWGKRDAKRN